MPPNSPASARAQQKKFVRNDSASSTNTMYMASNALSDDDIQVVQRSPQLTPKSASFMHMDATPPVQSPGASATSTAMSTPAGERSQSQAELTRTATKSPKPEHRKRPSFKRSLSSLWKVLDPPELAHNTGALHNIAEQFETDPHRGRRKKSAGPGDVEREHMLLATISDKVYKQRI